VSCSKECGAKLKVLGLKKRCTLLAFVIGTMEWKRCILLAFVIGSMEWKRCILLAFVIGSLEWKISKYK